MQAKPVTSINARLPVETGPGTPGGDLLRRFWQPVMLLQHFPPGCDPVAIRSRSGS